MSEASRLLLGIDTSGSEGSLAIGRMAAGGGVTLMQQAVLQGRHYADEVVPQLKVLFTQAGVTLQDFKAIVVVSGPGSFTGLRAGIAAAKAMAEVAGLPIVAVSRLALLAGVDSLSATHIGSARLSFEDHRAIVTVLDAGREEYYTRMPSGEESVMSHAELLEAAGPALVRTCEARVEGQFAGLRLEVLTPPTAFDAILLAAPRVVADNFEDVATLDANYVRRPYANFAGPV